MNHIGDTVRSLQSEFKGKMDRAKKLNDIRIRENGWPPDVECAECGDTGTIPETKRLCWCRAGRQQAARLAHTESWRKDIPFRYGRYTLAGHPSARARAVGEGWLSGRPWDAEVGANLVISGPVGTGKTGLGIGVLREAHFQGVKVEFTNVPDILTEMTGLQWADKSRRMSAYQNVPLLLLDDLGAEAVRDWSASMLYEVIEGRYRNGAPTIITSNLTKREMRDAVGDRIVSRVFDGATVLDLSGDDLRKGGTSGNIYGTGVRE